MTYSRKTWANSPAGGTPLDATGLNDWEGRIEGEVNKAGFGSALDRQVPARYDTSGATVVWKDNGWIDVRDPQFGAKGDCNQTFTTIAITSGVNTGTVGTLPADLRVGHTICIDGVGNLIVQNIAGTTITFTTNSPGTAAAAKFIYGTDNTTPLNNAFDYAFANRLSVEWPSGSYLITGTIGREAGPTNGLAGLTIRVGGAEINSGRLSSLGNYAGTTLIWGGSAGGTMMKWNRVSHVNWLGGIAVIGQPSYDPSGVFTPFLNRAGLGYLLSQDGTPYVGTGYHRIGDILFGDITKGFQFGELSTDNNCDTTRIDRLVAWRVDWVGEMVNAQALGYTFGYIQTVSCPRGIVFTNGGYFDCQMWNITGCDGSASTSGPGGGPTYQLEAKGQTWGFTYNIASLRAETNSSYLLYVDSEASEINVTNFIEAQPSQNKRMFYVRNGFLRFGIAKLDSYSTVFGANTRPFYIDATSSKTGKLVIDDLVITGPGGVVDNLSRYFEYGNNAINDVTVRSIRDFISRTYLPINTKFVKGPVFLLGSTTSATPVVLTQAGTGTGNVYGFGPRVPKGYSVIDICLIGDRGSGSFSVFKRRLSCWRTTGNTTIVSTATIDTDSAQGTDAITIAVDTTTHVLRVSATGTAATTIAWQATCHLVGCTNAADV